jgi:hypothetical protein
MKNSKRILVGAMIMATTLGAKAENYDVQDRYRLLEDKFKTEEMLNAYGHDFIVDIKAAANKNLLEFVDDVKEASETEGTTLDKVAAAQVVLDKWEKTEQTTRIKAQFGVPLPTFTAFGVKVVPDLRFGADWGANIGIRKETITASDIIDFLAGDTESEVIDAVKNLTETEFATLRGAPYNGSVGKYLEAEKGIDASIADQYDDLVIDDVNSVDFFALTKLDVKAGLLFNMTKDIYFGYLNLYGMHRTDYFLRYNASSVAAGQSFTDMPDETNSQVFAMADIKFGAELIWDSTAYILIEDIEIARMSDNIAKGGDLNYAPKALIRLHADTRFKLSGFSLSPFVGLHKREGYDLSSGVYAGADFGAHVWGDRLGVRVRGMIDKEHFTLSPQLKLWFMHFDYSLKTPMSSTVDDVKVSTIHSLNVRLFF